MSVKVSPRLIRELARAWAIAKKDLRIHYLRPGLIMFGILFPVFLFISFAVGRDVSPVVLVPGFVAMTIFFSASSTGAMSVPTERKTKTYDRLLTAPVSPVSILLGQTLAGFFFAVAISAIPLLIGVLWYGVGVTSVTALVIGICLASFEFSAMGIMFAAMPTDNPGDVMMVLNFIRLPLLFVSGIFVPIEAMGSFGFAAALSPLTFPVDLLRYAFGGVGYYGVVWDVAGVLAFTVLFFALGVALHERNRKKA
jgi:ABC-2 type transport system permease protein